LDNSTVGGSLIWVDALVGLLDVEEVRHDLHDTGNMEWSWTKWLTRRLSKSSHPSKCHRWLP
jgi:hypothetical protein